MQELVYHGTDKFFTKFSRKFLGSAWGENSGGFYFTSNKKIAKEYANILADRRSEKSLIYTCKLEIKNPLILDISQVNKTNKHGFLRESKVSPEQLDIVTINYIVNKLNKSRYKHKDKFSQLCDKEIKKRCSNYVSKLLNNTSYDGIIIKNAKDEPMPEDSNFPPSEIYVALSPKQVKIIEIDIKLIMDKTLDK